MKLAIALHVVLSLAALAFGAEVTPVGKVIEMLKDMKGKGEKEMQEEQVQYAAFEQFCESTATEKQRSIDEAKDAIEALEANIEKNKADARRFASEIAAHAADVEAATTEKQEATKVRTDERADFIAMLKDYSESIDAIGRALRELRSKKTNKDTSLVQLQSLQLPEKASRDLHALLSEGYDLKQDSSLDSIDLQPTADAYEFQSGGVISMLEKLQDKFVDERVSLEKNELNKKHAFDLMARSLDTRMKQSKKQQQQKSTFKSKALQDQASGESDLSESKAGLKVDTEYAADLAATCRKKAADFKERQRLRKEELEAIGKATEIISSPQISGASLVQTSKRPASVLGKLRAEGKNPVQAEVARFLQRQANQLNSRALSALAQRANSDAFDKVKEMIQSLLTRMQEQASEETTQKAYCDKELATSKATREEKTDAVSSLQAEADELKATIEKLGENSVVLTSELSELNAAMARATELRQKEKHKNAATVKDAKQATEAVVQAITVLNEFYAKAGAASLLQVGAQKVAQPEGSPAVFGDESYTGMQGAKGGVVGLLEVIETDFARLEAETAAEEEAAAKEYDGFMDESKIAKAEKSKEVEYKASKKQEKSSELVSIEQDLLNTQKELDAATAYFETLKPKCLDSGASYEERKQRREEEIQQLKEALTMIDNAA